jgi:hypothetical protein
MNNDPQPRSLHVALDPYSEYLKDRVTFSKQQFVLLPGQAENVQLTVTPGGLGPETHTLKVGVYDNDTLLNSFSLLITVPGEPVERYVISAQAQDTVLGSAVPVSVTLENFGNVIGYAKLDLTIEQQGKVIGSVTYPTTYQLIPNSKSSYDLVYSDTLEPGFYTAKLSASFPTQIVNATSQFSVRLGEVTQQVPLGSDLILTFASLGNPQTVKYSLVDKSGSERAAGVAVPQNGDVVVATSALPAGTYDLTLDVGSTKQHVVVVVQDSALAARYALIAAVVLILGVALYSYRSQVSARWRLYHLRREIEWREEEVTKLINRAHRLVDRYTILHGRAQRPNRLSGTTGQGPR